jgi:hypothetical protein
VVQGSPRVTISSGKLGLRISLDQRNEVGGGSQGHGYELQSWMLRVEFTETSPEIPLSFQYC